MNAAHERARVMRERAESWREAGLIDELYERAIEAQFPQPWRTYGLFAQAAFFLLTSLAIAAAFVLLDDQLNVEYAGLLTALGCIVLAELLIGGLRWFGTGVEAALWLGGLFAAVGDLAAPYERQLLALSAAAAIAGWRVRQPLFGAIAACCFAGFCEREWDFGVVASLAIASIAAAMLCRSWRRPSTEWLWIALALGLPVYGWTLADEVWRSTTIVLYALFGAATLFAALRKRHHALFFTSIIAIAIAAIELAEEWPWPAETKLAIGGAFLLATSFCVARVLRDRTTGFVTTKESLTGLDSTLEIAGTLVAAPPEPPPPPDSLGGGGRFGGAGATGDY